MKSSVETESDIRERRQYGKGKVGVDTKLKTPMVAMMNMCLQEQESLLLYLTQNKEDIFQQQPRESNTETLDKLMVID